MSTRIVSFVFFALALQSWAMAQRGFISGDSYYSTMLNETFDRFKRVDDRLVINYVQLEGGGLGDFTGCHRLAVIDPGKTLEDQLSRALAYYRKELWFDKQTTVMVRGDTTYTSVNSLTVLIYNKEFPAHELPIGLLYNEKFFDLPVDPIEAMYQCQWVCPWKDTSAVRYDLIHSRSTPELRLSQDSLDKSKSVQPSEQTPVPINISDIKFVIVLPTFFEEGKFPDPDFIDYAQSLGDELIDRDVPKAEPDEVEPEDAEDEQIIRRWLEISDGNILLFESTSGKVYKKLIPAK